MKRWTGKDQALLRERHEEAGTQPSSTSGRRNPDSRGAVNLGGPVSRTPVVRATIRRDACDFKSQQQKRQSGSYRTWIQAMPFTLTVLCFIPFSRIRSVDVFKPIEVSRSESRMEKSWYTYKAYCVSNYTRSRNRSAEPQRIHFLEIQILTPVRADGQSGLL